MVSEQKGGLRCCIRHHLPSVGVRVRMGLERVPAIGGSEVGKAHDVLGCGVAACRWHRRLRVVGLVLSGDSGFLGIS